MMLQNVVLLVAVLVSSAVLGQDKPPEPTAEQVQKAKDDYAKVGATYQVATRAGNAAPAPCPATARPSSRPIRIDRPTNRSFVSKHERTIGLGLRKCSIDDTGAVAFANSPNLANLVQLDLYDNRILSKGLFALIESSCLQNLRYLSVSSWAKIQEDVWQAFEKRFGK